MAASPQENFDRSRPPAIPIGFAQFPLLSVVSEGHVLGMNPDEYRAPLPRRFIVALLDVVRSDESVVIRKDVREGRGALG